MQKSCFAPKPNRSLAKVMYINSLIDAIGKTPLVRISRFAPRGNIFAKVEAVNPGGSIKDRAALFMIKDAEEKGLLQKGGSVVEPTSGNTGIGLAWICSILGCKLTLTMPDSMSVERQSVLKALGADIALTPGALGMTGAINKAKEIAKETGAFMPMQFENTANPKSHEQTTALELLEDMDGKIDALVAAVGTGGTLTGIARVLKEKCPSIRIIAVEPQESPVISGGAAGPHGIQGIGAGFIPKNLDMSLVDEVIQVSTAQAYECTRRVAKTEGIFCGISSGAALRAALEIDCERVAVILPDTGDRYLSTPLFK